MHSLQIPTDERLQRSVWRFERVCWVLLAAMLLACLLGFFGPGLLGDAIARSPGGSIEAQYSRFLRAQSPAVTSVRMRPAAIAHAEIRLSVDDAFLREVSLLRVLPEPRSEEVSVRGVTFVFARSAGDEPVTVHFEYEARAGGRVEGRFGGGAGEEVLVRHFVFP